MPHIITTTHTPLDREDLAWIVGTTVRELTFAEPHSWYFRLSNGGLCTCDAGTWTLEAPQGIVASSDDHGHPFGLSEPFDARAVAMKALDGERVVRASVAAGRPDLILEFAKGLTLAVLALSIGYECWQLRDPNGRNLAVTGGRVASTWQD